MTAQTTGKPAAEKFFIVGCPRSGTTMLQQALNRHSQIIIPAETKFFFSFYGHSRRRQIRQLRRINADLRIDLRAPARAVCSPSEGRAYYEEMAGQYLGQQGKPGVAFFGEKTPEHTGLLPQIRQLYPDAKVIFLHRDGRDVASSLTRVPWMSSNLYANFAVWLYYYRILRHERWLARPNVYFACYENLVANPDCELRSILRFLGAAFEPAVARGWGNREGVPPRELAWKARALEPITAERSEAFCRELTRGQIEALEALGGEALLALGYPLRTGGQKVLSGRFYLSLGLSLAKLAYRLPWSSLLKDFCCRLVAERPTAGPRLETMPALFAALQKHYACPAPAASAITRPELFA